MTVPAGVLMKTPSEAGIECVMEKKSIWKAPSVMWEPSLTSLNLGFLMRCSSSLPWMKPRVSLELKMGTLRVRSISRYGRAPVWSSWPWVMMMPLSLSSFSRT